MKQTDSKKNKKVNKKLFTVPLMVSAAGLLLCLIGARLSEEVNAVAFVGFAVLSIGSIIALHASVSEKYRLGDKIRFPLSLIFPAYPVVEDYDLFTRNMSSFREVYSEFMAHENRKSNSDLQDYVTQLLWHCLYLQRLRMEKLGIQMELDSNRRSYLKNLPSVHYNAYFDGRYHVDDVCEEIYAVRTFRHEGRIVKIVHNKEVVHYIFLSPEGSGEEEMVCPNCGNVSSKSNLMDGCDYCKTKFTVEDLENRIGSFGFRRDFQVSQEKRKAIKKRIYPWIYMVGMMPMMYMGLFLPFLYGKETNLFMKLIAGVIIAGGLVFMGFALVTSSLFFIVPLVCLFNNFWSVLDDKLVYRSPTEWKAEMEMAERVRKSDPLFSIQSFFGNIQNKLYAIHFADTENQVNAFSDCDLSECLEKYREVVDIETLSLSLLFYESKDGIQNATARASLLLREFKNNKMKERKEYVTLYLEKNEDCKTQAVCAPAILTCEGCGGSLSFMEGKRCKFCGRELNMKEHDWVITKYFIAKD